MNLANLPLVGQNPRISFGLLSSNTNWKLLNFISGKSLSQLPLLPEQIDLYASALDWNQISTRDLPEWLFIKHADKIKWLKFLQTGKKSVTALFKAKKYVRKYKYLFYNEDFAKIYYSDQFAKLFPTWININLLFGYPLKEETIIKFWPKNKTLIDQISKSQPITDLLATKYRRKINWNLASEYNTLSEQVIEIADDYIDWKIICRTHTLDEKFIIKHIFDVCFVQLAIHQKLSTDFIERYWKKLDHKLISRYQDLPIDFIRSNITELDLPELSKNPNFNKPGTIQVIYSGLNWYIIEPPIIVEKEPDVYFISL